MFRSLLVFVFVALPLLVRAGSGGGPSPSKAAPLIGFPVNQIVSKGNDDPSYKVWNEADQVEVSDTGEIRSFHIKEGINVGRDQFFSRYGVNLNLGNDGKMVERTAVDLPALGVTVSRHGQTYKGLEVFDSDYVLQEKDGRVEWAFGDIRAAKDLDGLDLAPQTSESAALESAVKDIGTSDYEWKAHLGIGSNRLVYRFVISSEKPFGTWTVDVDAKTGKVIDKLSALFHEAVPSKGATYYNGPQEFTAGKYEKEGQNHYNLVFVKDFTEGAGVFAYDWGPSNQQGTFALGFDEKKGIVSFTDSNDDNYFDDPEDKAGVTVFWAVQKAMDYYQTRFGWIGWHGKNKPFQSIDLTVNAKYTVDGEAYYDSNRDGLYFSSVGQLPGEGPMIGLDIIGHEFTHGLIAHTSRLKGKSESGALNEGFADIFGAMLEFYVQDSNANWTYGEDAFYGKNYVRNVQNPKILEYPDTYKGDFYTSPVNVCILFADGKCQEFIQACSDQNDFCDVHKHSTIASHWFYLLVNGGTGKNDKNDSYFVTGIGREKAAKVAFLTMISLKPSADFADARLVSIAAAKTLAATVPGFGLADVIAVTNAWQAVGVGPQYQAERKCEPGPGGAPVDGWPAALRCEARPNEVQWEFQVSTSPGFDKDVKKFSTNAMSPGLGQPTVGVSVNLDAKTSYFWRMRAKTMAPEKERMISALHKIGDLLVPRLEAGAWPARKEAPGSRAKAGTETLLRAKAEDSWEDWSSASYFFTSSKAPTPKSPTSVAPVQPWAAEFFWTPVSGAEGYVVEAIPSCQKDQPASGGFKPAVVSWMEGYFKAISSCKTVTETVGKSKTTAILKLKKLTDYGWRVRALGPGGVKGDWSLGGGTLSFTTTDPKAGGLWPDSKNAYWFKASPVRFQWKMLPGAQNYRLRFYKRLNGAPGKFIYGLLTPGAVSQTYNDERWWEDPSTLLSEDKGGYCWTVAGIGPAGDEGLESDPGCYPIAPPKPAIISPAHGSTNVEYSPTTLAWTNPWEKEYPVDYYKITIDDVGNGGNYHIEKFLIGTQHTETLYPARPYKWRIDAYDKQSGLATASSSNPSNYAVPSYFITKPAPKPPPQQQNQQQQQQGGGQTVASPSLLCPLGYGYEGTDYFASTPPTYKFKWSKVSGATNYLLTIYSVNYPNDNLTQVFQQEYGDVGESFPIPHAFQTVYRWDIRARSANGPWSSPTLSDLYTPTYAPAHYKSVLMKCGP